nr:hypothetical protein [uncultured Halomonas sp.]
MNDSIFADAKAANLNVAVVVGLDSDGKVQLFLDDADRERLVMLLERAKTALVRSMDN